METVKLVDYKTTGLSNKALDHLMFIKANDAQYRLTKALLAFKAKEVG